MSLSGGNDELSPPWQTANTTWSDVGSPMAQDPDSDEAYEIDSAMGLDQTAVLSRNVAFNEVMNATARLSDDEKTEYVIRMLQTMDKRSIIKVNKAMQDMLRFDPIQVLPVEIINQIVRYLEPKDVLRLGATSRQWRLRTLDSGVWRRKYLDEGWQFDAAEIESFERGLKSLKFEAATSPDLPFREPFLSPGLNITRQSRNAGKLPEEKDGPPVPGNLQAMLDRSGTRADPQDINSMIEAAKTSLVLVNARGEPRLNHFYIFRARMMLENNWTEGRYTTFQIPSPEHATQAHTGCCYSIHFSRRFLVSGSRDMTIGIWDLSTQTLLRPPLVGHRGSVLCVQFDESPDEDVIMSGSSDTCVIIWRFSTGEMLRKLANAHENSVLNLKFDKRYLVTCSKDRLIKIWNREALLPTSDLYPQRASNGGVCAEFILDLAKLPSPLDLERDLTPTQRQPVPPYSVIMTINAHSAAVNAVLIREDSLVSISGDKTIRIFNIKTGVQQAMMRGHRKGIACLSYDGHRIVTGSSDQTIRIFDPISKCQTQHLGVHTNLVRTLQAHFVDYPTCDLAKELKSEAQLADKEHLLKASRRPSASERFLAHATSPEVFVPGCSIPPDGGGNKWSKIVSGSYDETVIVWRKSEKGWTPSLDLRQIDVLRDTIAAGHPPLDLTEVMPRSGRIFTNDETLDHIGERRAAREAGDEDLFFERARPADPVRLHPMLQPLPNTEPGRLNDTPALNDVERLGVQEVSAMLDAFQTRRNMDRAQELASTRLQMAEERIALTQSRLRWMERTAQDIDAQREDLAAGQERVAELERRLRTVASAADLGRVVRIEEPPRDILRARLLNREAANPDPAIRVYKLQFDARCIIDCSQTSRIIGWDFADGNADILNCVRFFAAPPS